MATTQTITPSLGNAPSFLQGGVGSSTGYGAIDFRRVLFGAPVQEGVITAGSFEVTERAAGAAMSVDIAASTGNGALVQGDAVTSQGLYYVPPHSASVNLDIATADATNPRVDTVWLEVEDDTHDAGGSNLARLRVISGTADAGATLDTRTGAASNPGSAILLADVLVPASDTTISNSQIRCRRPWARGAYYRIVRNANAAAGNNYTTTSGTMAAVDSTNLNPRLECSGVPVEITLRGLTAHSAADVFSFVGMRVDGAALDGGAIWGLNVSAATGTLAAGFEATWHTVPAAGSHRFAPYFATNSGTLELRANATQPLQFTVAEIVRQNTHNAVTGTG